MANVVMFEKGCGARGLAGGLTWCGVTKRRGGIGGRGRGPGEPCPHGWRSTMHGLSPRERVLVNT